MLNMRARSFGARTTQLSKVRSHLSIFVARASTGKQVLPECKAGDIVRLDTTAGSYFAEVLSSSPSQGCVVAWKGQELELSLEGVRQIGVYPLESSSLVTALPAFAPFLPSCHTHAGTADWTLTSMQVVSSLRQLQHEVKNNSSKWCHGTEPGAPENTPKAAALMTAGELLALMSGQRGVATVQLWNGWDATKGQPVYDPLILPLLTQALAHPDIRCVTSSAPGGQGLTAVIFVNREPWVSWGPHLASFGFQANIVAGSPYYKLLTGKILGYKDSNVRDYTIATSPQGSVTVELMAMVTADLAQLSKVKPTLPWKQTVIAGSRGKKAKPAGAKGFGKGP